MNEDEDSESQWASCHCIRVRRASRYLSRLYEEQIEASGLKSTQYALLIALRDFGPCSFGAAARLLTMDRATLGHTLRPLERHGLVATSIDPQDRRSKRVGVTPAGAARIERGYPGWEAAQEKIELALGKEDAATLHHLLDRLLAHTTP